MGHRVTILELSPGACVAVLSHHAWFQTLYEFHSYQITGLVA